MVRGYFINESVHDKSGYTLENKCTYTKASNGNDAMKQAIEKNIKMLTLYNMIVFNISDITVYRNKIHYVREGKEEYIKLTINC